MNKIIKKIGSNFRAFFLPSNIKKFIQHSLNLFWYITVARSIVNLTADKNTIRITFPALIINAHKTTASYEHCLAMMKRRQVRFVFEHIERDIFHNFIIVHNQISAICVLTDVEIFSSALCSIIIYTTIFSTHYIHTLIVSHLKNFIHAYKI